MTDKLAWYPTTIEELQRLLDSGVWPRVRAIADDVGPLQIAQGRLTYIDRKDGRSGILREGSASAGAEPFDLTTRALWLWRAEATEPAKREHTMVIRLDKPPRFEPEQGASIEEALVKLERLIDSVRSWPEHVRWLDIAGPIRSWCAEVRCSGTLDLPLVVAVCDAVGKLALDVDKLDHVRVASAAGSIARTLGELGVFSPAARATESLRSLLTTAASMMARFPGPTAEEIKEPEFDMPPSVAGVDFCVVELDGGGWRMEASCDDPEGPLGPECVVRGEEHDSKAEAVVGAWEFAFGLRTNQLDIALEQSTRPSDVEAEVERLADYLLRHHASECTGPGSGVSAVDVAIRLLKRAGDFESRRLDLARCSVALRRIAAASNLMVLGMRGPEFAMELAERVEQQFTDFRKVADRLGTDREIAGAAEQLVRRLVDRLVETDPEYIEQLRRSGS